MDERQSLVEAAQQYLNMGLKVIALTGKAPNGKVHPHGLKDALDTERYHTQGLLTELTRCFSHPATTGIGILTTWPLVVVDIDGEDGAQAWKALAGDEYMPDRWVAKTGRGLHLYFFSIEQVGSMKLAPLLDLKGEGGYVAAPPSLHPDGHRYEWLLPPDECWMIEVPVRLAERIRAHLFDQERRIVRSAQQKRIRHAPLEDGVLWASWGYDGIINRMLDASEGERNNYLHWAAATMAEEGALEEEFESLRAAALDAGLTHLETKRTIRSARRGHGE